MKKTFLLPLVAAALLTSCGTEEESSNSTDTQNEEVEVTVKDDSYTPDDQPNSPAGDTIAIAYDIPENYETTILEENGDWYTLKVDFTTATYYVDSSDMTYEIVAPVGTFYMTDPAEYDASLLNHKMECPAIIGEEFYQTLNIAAENKEIILNEMFFANHTLGAMRHDFDGQNFYLYYEYYACDMYDCGIMVRYIIDTQNQTNEVSVSEFNHSAMM